MNSHKEVRYVVYRLKDPGDGDGDREPLGFYAFLDLAKRHADRMGEGTWVDAEGGTYHLRGPSAQRGQWQVEWINPNLYQGRRRHAPDPGQA